MSSILKRITKGVLSEKLFLMKANMTSEKRSRAVASAVASAAEAATAAMRQELQHNNSFRTVEKVVLRHWRGEMALKLHLWRENMQRWVAQIEFHSARMKRVKLIQIRWLRGDSAALIRRWKWNYDAYREAFKKAGKGMARIQTMLVTLARGKIGLCVAVWRSEMEAGKRDEFHTSLEIQIRLRAQMQGAAQRSLARTLETVMRGAFRTHLYIWRRGTRSDSEAKNRQALLEKGDSILIDAKTHVSAILSGAFVHTARLARRLGISADVKRTALWDWKLNVERIQTTLQGAIQTMERNRSSALKQIGVALAEVSRGVLATRLRLWRDKKNALSHALEVEILNDELWLGLKGAAIRQLRAVMSRIIQKNVSQKMLVWRMRAEDNRIVTRTMDYMRGTTLAGQHDGLRQMLHLVRDNRARGGGYR